MLFTSVSPAAVVRTTHQSIELDLREELSAAARRGDRVYEWRGEDRDLRRLAVVWIADGRTGQLLHSYEVTGKRGRCRVCRSGVPLTRADVAACHEAPDSPFVSCEGSARLPLGAGQGNGAGPRPSAVAAPTSAPPPQGAAVRSVFTSYKEADALRRDAARAQIRFIADTLTVQVPEAAYLVLGEKSDDLWFECLADASGAPIRELNRPLPQLPQGSPLEREWRSAGLDPTSPDTLFRLVEQLVHDGMVLDEMPDDLPAEDAPFETPCILLSRAASPGTLRPSPHVLRPYSATGPTVKDAESPLSELLPALGTDGLRTAVRAGIELYGEYGDAQHALSEEQVRQLCRAAAQYA